MKRLKRILIVAIMTTLVFLIYITNIDNKIYYVALGDSLAAGQTPYGEKVGYGYSDYVKDYLDEEDKLELYTKDFAISGYRTTDLTRDLEDNKKVTIDQKEVSMKQALIKADVVTISIGANDLLYKLGVGASNLDFQEEESLYQYIDEIMNDVDKLLKLTREYCKEDIILVGYYSPITNKLIQNSEGYDKIFEYAREEYKQVTKKYQIHYIDVYDTFKDHYEYLPNPTDFHPSTKGYQAIANEIIKVINQDILK